MTLYFSLIDADGTVQGPCICRAALDVQLDVLNSFVALGNKLVSAYLLDENGHHIYLPVKAFDGQPIADSIRQLTQEYQHVLSGQIR